MCVCYDRNFPSSGGKNPLLSFISTWVAVLVQMQKEVDFIAAANNVKGNEKIFNRGIRRFWKRRARGKQDSEFSDGGNYQKKEKEEMKTTPESYWRVNT